MKHFKLISILILLSLGNRIFSSEIIGGFGGPKLTMMYHNLGNLNQVITSKNYQPFNEISWGIAGGGGGFYKNIFIGGWGLGTFPQYSDNGTNILRLDYSYGGFNIGYCIININNITLIPIIGFGGGGFNMNISPAYGTNNNFQNIISDPINTYAFGYNMSSDSIAVEIGIKSYLTFEIASLGINIGYIFMPSNNWTIEGNKLLNTPTITQHIIYASIDIYFGSIFTNKITLGEVK